MRKSTDIKAELEAVEREQSVLRLKHKLLLAEWREAKVAEANVAPHEWLGKTVKRLTRRGYRQGVSVRSGVLTIFDPTKHTGLRELYCTEPGDLFVLSKSGLTGWRFQLTGSLGVNETDWELA